VLRHSEAPHPAEAFDDARLREPWRGEGSSREGSRTAIPGAAFRRVRAALPVITVAEVAPTDAPTLADLAKDSPGFTNSAASAPVLVRVAERTTLVLPMR
jgi:hypothetical protein